MIAASLWESCVQQTCDLLDIGRTNFATLYAPLRRGHQLDPDPIEWSVVNDPFGMS